MAKDKTKQQVLRKTKPRRHKAEDFLLHKIIPQCCLGAFISTPMEYRSENTQQTCPISSRQSRGLLIPQNYPTMLSRCVYIYTNGIYVWANLPNYIQTKAEDFLLRKIIPPRPIYTNPMQWKSGNTRHVCHMSVSHRWCLISYRQSTRSQFPQCGQILSRIFLQWQ